MRISFGWFMVASFLWLGACEASGGGGSEGSSGAEVTTRGGRAAHESESETTVELVRQDSAGSPAAEGHACTSSADCREDEMCSGPEGCDVAWTCQPVRPCTRDLRVYCGCDGQTFEGSGSCPPRPFARRGPCEAPE